MKFIIVLLVLCLYNVRSGEFKDDILAVHNKFRKSILDGTERLQPKAKTMPMLTWNDELAKNAKKWADTCQFKHNTEAERKITGYNDVGQNLFSGPVSSTNEAAVIAWYDEISYYNYDTLACTDVCGHYTQVIWAATTMVGCAKSPVCPGGNIIVVCDYATAGNYIGQKPYVKDEAFTRAPETTAKAENIVLTDYQRTLLDTHNKYRQMVLDGFYMEQPQAKSMNMLVWNSQLAASAQKVTNTCKTDLTPLSDRLIPGYKNVGQSMHFCVTQGWRDEKSVEEWFSEQSDYTHATDSCKGFCGNYKQIVWANTKELGCAKTVCGDRTIAVCHYAEGANRYSGRPYEAVPEKDRPTTLPPTPPPTRPFKDKFKVWGDDAETKPSSFQEEMVFLHNNYRKLILNGEEARQPQAASMPMLEWHPTLAMNAQAHAEACEFNFAMPATRLIANYTFVNRNLFIKEQMLPKYPVTGRDAMEDWYSQINKYEYDTNTCSYICDSYTQIVAAKTTRVGCGMAVCPRDKVFIVCDYAEGECVCTKKQPYAKVPDEPLDNYAKEMLDLHNKYRQGILTGSDTRQPPAMALNMLRWNKKLAKYAQKQADVCLTEDDPKKRKEWFWEFERVGQNAYFTYYREPSSAAVMYEWFDRQITNYNYDRNRCNTRDACNNYLQIVSFKTNYVGCAKSSWCPMNRIQIVCFYGEGMIPNDWPYMKTTPTTTIAPTTPAPTTLNPDIYSKQALGILNEHRNKILTGKEARQPKPKEMPVLQWDPELAANARKLSTACKDEASTQEQRQTSKFKNVGEIYNNVGGFEFIDAFRGWWGGASWYDYAKNTCSMGDDMCAPYRQIVYYKSTHVGCSTSLCGGRYTTLCHFNNEISAAERPYMNGVDYEPDFDYYDKFKTGFDGIRWRIANGRETRVPRAKKLDDINWDTGLGNTAKLMADLCTGEPSLPFQRQHATFKNVGESIYAEDFGKPNPTRTISSWLERIIYFDSKTNKCMYYDELCEPFMQMVSSKVTHFGCATTICGTTTITYCHFNEAVKSGDKLYDPR